MNKRNLFKVISMMLICSFCIITIAYSWFTRREYIGNQMVYNKALAIGTLDTIITNYYGVVNDSGTVEYLPIVDDNDESTLNFNIDSLCPSGRQYFKIEIRNNSDVESIFSLYLEDVEYDAVLDEHIYFAVTSAGGSYRNYSESSVESADNPNNKIIENVEIVKRCIVEPGATATIYWYVTLDKSTGNEAMYKKIHIPSMRLFYNS